MCTQAFIANVHLLGQLRICGIVQLVTHLGINAYPHSFQRTKYFVIYYKVNMYIHDCMRVEKDNLRTECDLGPNKHWVRDVTHDIQFRT